MSFFKKKIDFVQFLADVITFQCDFLENNFNKMVVLADEYKVLTEKAKKEFFDKAHELLIVDILLSCGQHFNNNLSSEEAGEAVNIVYRGYLTEYKISPKEEVEKKLDSVMKLVDFVIKAEEDAQRLKKWSQEIGYESHGFKDEVEKQKFYLCQGFCDYCVGKDMKSENWEGKNFAAFKFAKAFVKADILGIMLKEYKIKFPNLK